MDEETFWFWWGDLPNNSIAATALLRVIDDQTASTKGTISDQNKSLNWVKGIAAWKCLFFHWLQHKPLVANSYLQVYVFSIITVR